VKLSDLVPGVNEIKFHYTYPQTSFGYQINKLSLGLKLDDTPPPEEYTLAVTTQGDGSVFLLPTGPYPAGTEVMLRGDAMEGWQFSQWIWDDGTIQTQNPTTIVLNRDRAVVAVFEEEGVPPPDYYSTSEVDAMFAERDAAIAKNTAAIATLEGEVANLAAEVTQMQAYLDRIKAAWNT
jgi:hypothetical protein